MRLRRKVDKRRAVSVCWFGGTWVGALLVAAAILWLPSVAGAAPTANNQSLGKLGPGKEVLFSLSYSGSPASFTIVSNPAHGTLQSYNSRAGTTAYPQYYYYKANTGYDGADSFTWKCADASGDSNVATCSVTISATPTANNQTATVVTGGEVLTSLSYSDPVGDKTCTFSILTGPAHGTVQSYNERNGVTYYPYYYYYKATAGYTGADSFTWKVNNGYADSVVATVSITVNANTAPVANNYSSTVSSSTRGSVYLSVAHSDSGQTMTYTLVSGPSHGTVEMPAPTTANGTYAYYTSAKDYVGGDSLTWKVSDGMAESGVATATITVNAIAPAPQNQTACVAKDTPTDIGAAYTGGGGYSYTVVKVTNPSHGTVSVTNSTMFHYVPGANYTGLDSFTWKMTYSTNTTATVTCSIWVKEGAGTDWPQWRCDEWRSAATALELPAQLYLQWRRDFPAYTTPGLLTKSSSDDFGYFQPVMAGTTVVVNVTGRDRLVGLDAASGAVKWTFYTDGPTRFPPVISNGRVYAPSDDGCLYCLDLQTGALISRIAACPSNRKFFGQLRLISPWMVRGGPMTAGGNVYFAAGLWALEGIFAFALNGATSVEIWRNDGLGGLITGQPHDGQPTVSGPSPQGYLCLKSDNSTLYVPGTEAEPALLNPSTGGVNSWWQGSTYGGGQDSQGYKAVINGGQMVNLGPFSGTPGTIPMQITAGARSYTATDAAALGVSGTVKAMLAGGNQLFVMTQQGSLYCFGGTQVTPGSYTVQTTPLPTINDQWTANAAQILAGATAKEGCILVAGIGTRRLAQEMVKQAPANAIIVAVDPDPNKVAALRAEMDAAGYYGSRIAAFAGDPLNSGFPQYGARLVVSEDAAAAGYGVGNDMAFVANLYRVIMPYSGMAWLPLSSGQQGTFAAEVAAANMDLATVGRSDPFATLTRTGLKNASNTKAGSAAYDKTVTGPLGFLWFNAANNGGGHGVNIPNANNYNGVVNQSGTRPYVDAFSGLPLSSSTWDGTSGVVSSSSAGSYINPFTGLPGPGHAMPGGYGCGAGFSGFGYIAAGRAGTAAFYDTLSDGGTVHIDGVRSCCGNPGGNVGSGVHYWDCPGCYCSYSLRASFALAPVPEVENWSRWGYGPTQDILDEKPLRLLGVNFGAPADHKAPDGKLWVGYPAQCGACPNVLMAASGPSLKSIYHHSSRIRNNGLKFVVSSVLQGATNFVVMLSQPVVALAAAQPPDIDGTLNDSCWDGNGRLMLCNNSMPSDWNPAHAWVRYDSSNLYVAVSGAQGSNNRWDVYLSGRENVAMDPNSYYADRGFCGVNRYARFGVDAAGNKMNALGASLITVSGEDATWQATWSAGISAAAGQPFTAEFAIPFATIAQAGLWKDNLIINIWGPNSKRLRDTGDSGYWYVLGGPGVCGRFVPMFYDTAKGDLAVPQSATIRLHFAETEGLTNGQRVFDVKLQGSTVLPSFDIAQAAGGSNNVAVVKEFTLPAVSGSINLDLVPKIGETLISGVEITGSYQNRALNMPTARLKITPASGLAPLAVTLSARESTDDVGIKKVEWNFGDGTSGIWSETTHTYTEPGTYTAVVRVTDSDGLMSTTVGTVTVGSVPAKPQDFVCKIRANGGDYTNLTTWQAAIVSDLTASNSLLFAVSGVGNYSSPTDDGKPVAFSGGATGVLRHVNSANLAYVTGCSTDVVVSAGTVTCQSGNMFTISATGNPIRHAIAECYNDWPTGLYNNVTIAGWTASGGHMVKIVAPVGQRHNGKPFLADGVTFSGFALVNNVDAQYAISVGQPNTRLEGVIVCGKAPTTGARIGGLNLATGSGQACWVDKCLVFKTGNGGWPSISCGSGGMSYQSNVIVIEDQGGGGLTPGYGFAVVYNCSFINGKGVGVYGGDRFVLRNILSAGNAGGDFKGSGLNIAYCASGDATADDWGGAGNRISQTFTFVNAANKDFHLASNDTGARNWGMNLAADPTLPVGVDIDGDLRIGAFDIGADECVDPMDTDGDGIPDAWEDANGMNKYEATDATFDSDHDGANNFMEYRAGTNPTNGLSLFKVTECEMAGDSNFVITWLSVAGKYYTIRGTTNLLLGFPILVTNHVPATPPQNSCAMPVDQGEGGCRFYRVGVEP